MMLGVIWFVQIVHYPLFREVPAEDFVSYESWHRTKTSLLVAPLMLVELGTAFLLVGMRPEGFSFTWLLVNGILLGLIWASTFFIQVPLHGALSEAFSFENIRKLVNSNWIRTILWTARGAILLGLLYKLLSQE